MTNLRHHPQGETLMSRAAGTMDPAFSLVLDCHLQFCRDCRRHLRMLDDAGGLLLDGISAPDDSAFFKRTMDRFAREIAQKESMPAPRAVLDPGNEVIMPSPLASTTGLRRETIPWKDLSGGLKTFGLPKLSGAAASALIIHIEPGAVLHSERHGGQLAAVLWGAYDYDGDRFERGDLHDISASGFKTFTAASAGGVTFLTAISPVPQIEIFRTAH